jgi:hydrogenase/urease accessory protein HupE
MSRSATLGGWVFRWSLCALLACGVLPAAADEFRPAYLQLTQIDATTYDVLWKLPALDESTTLKLRPQFPPGTQELSPVHTSFAGGTAVQRWRIQVGDGLAGQAVEFPDLPMNRIDVLVRLARSDGTVQLGRVLPLEPRYVFAEGPGAYEVVQTYTLLGIEHILMGIDHLLFVLALLILVKGTGRLIATVTAFTVAHSLTLFAATLGWVHVPGPPVEAAIALSIVFVASEIIHAQQGRLGLTQRYPWVVAFAFGLLHGLGFAGALAEVGLPQLSIPLALLFFNVGVEIGQLLFIAAILLLVAAWRRAASHLSLSQPNWTRQIPPYALGGLASYWVVARVAAF